MIHIALGVVAGLLIWNIVLPLLGMFGILVIGIVSAMFKGGR